MNEQLETKVREAKKNGTCRCPVDIPTLKSLLSSNFAEVKGLNLRANGDGYIHSVLYDGVEFVSRSKTKVYF